MTTGDQTTDERYVIKHDNGSYFVKFTGIGPMFGGARSEAAEFPSKNEAARMCMRHWAFGDTEVVPA